MTNLNILRFHSTIARLNRHSLLILNLRYISRVTGYDAIYYMRNMVPKYPIRNNVFDLGHFDELKFREFGVLLTSLFIYLFKSFTVLQEQQ